MNETLALRLLRKIMEWDEETATREYRWLRLMSRLKFDGYRDYLAGVRFAESLAGWLTQFGPEHRGAAYDFVKNRLIYFSPPEIQRLVEQLYPRFVEPRLREDVGRATSIAPYMVWANAESRQLFERKRRQVLFIGLSDGARIDILRRANSGILANDQVVLATHIDDDKWRDLGDKLRKDKLFVRIDRPTFEAVYLVDDFTGSGTSFVRPKPDRSWTGKLEKFWTALTHARMRIGADFPLKEDFSLHIHHYISSSQAKATINERLATIAGERADNPSWFKRVELSEGILLPESVRLTQGDDPEMWAVCEKYYDHGLFEELKEHLDESGQTHIRHGYGNSALPVVLEHNCPNNAITLLWAETEGGGERHPMRALFPRRHRHS
jgi:hypothetical protein